MTPLAWFLLFVFGPLVVGVVVGALTPEPVADDLAAHFDGIPLECLPRAAQAERLERYL